MERNLLDENFERFLRKSADGLRMRPGDRVWKGISRQLYKRRRRFGLLFGALFLSGTIAISYYSWHLPAPRSTATIPSQQKESSVKTPFQNGTSIENITRNTDRIALLPSIKPGQAKYSPVNGQQLTALNNLTSYTSTAQQTEGSFNGTVIDSYADIPSHEKTAEVPLVPYHFDHPAQTDLPLSIESVINSFRRSKSKFSTQVYFTPTISYRKLGENKSYLRTVPASNIPYSYPRIYNVNDAVTQRPSFGFEFGWAAKYRLTDKVKLKGGFQFNVNRYDVKAFNSTTQLATIQLNTRNAPDSLNTVTNYSNVAGYGTDWLQNYYFEISAPVGVEVRLRGDEKVQFGIAATVQPTYLLGNRTYLLTTDYKSYAEVPWLTRRWNVNTGLETFVNYSTGHLNWQVGPQVRYQLLSSFINKYPVKENLYDFGLKVGISVNK